MKYDIKRISKKHSKKYSKKHSKKHSKKYSKKHSKKHSKKGGKVINSGGFGCIFQPALKCKNSKKRHYGISKLLLKNNADKEWKILTKIYNILKKIPNYYKYFLIKDFYYCIPDTLSYEDMKNLQKCNNIISDMNRINYELDKYKIINMPYGGKDLETIISDKTLNFSILNKNLVALLKNGIIPMNKLRLYHCDIKSSNIVYYDNIRIIDWGISEYFNTLNFTNIPSKFINQSFQFNSPYSRVIFNKKFKKNLSSFLSKYKNGNIDDNKLEEFLYECFFINFSSNMHSKFLNQYFFPEFFKLNNINISSYSYNLISKVFSKYCKNIILNFTDFKSNNFKFLEYFKNVYIKNVDIIGFISIYVEYILSNNYNKSLKIKICNLLIKYMLSSEYSAKPINIDTLIIDLNNLENNLENNKDNEKINIDKIFDF